ncbi:FUSC family protein [Herbaspirillum sp. WKF16]|uniref:FUSC family protein n=1 Tax=Herbaspirillum sp. WKF16 TaxID=3028312 RepID=UPI0023A93689|nr:FUSC family protein [Herbaspirillum sp. WKF16]WDZ96257.1 FUSC family protein [Herbaspirillum sp. WKF16]
MPPPLSTSCRSLFHSSIETCLRRCRQQLERWRIRFPLRNANLSEGLRAACGASAMLLLGEWLGNPLFSWAAIGAFLTCLADSAGSSRARLASMGGFALASTLGGMLAAGAAGIGVGTGLLAIMACAGAAGFSRVYGAAAGLVLMLAAGVSAIMADAPTVLWPPQHSHVLIYFAGCLWAMLLGLTVWRIHPFAPARRAVARVYGTLAELAALGSARDGIDGRDDPAQLAHAAELAAHTRRHARFDIAAAHRALAAVAAERTESRRLYENLLVRLARAGELLDCITVLADLRLTHYQPPEARRRTARVLAAIARLLQGMQRAMATGDAIAADDDARIMLRLRQLVARLPSGAGRVLQLVDAPLAAGEAAADAGGLKSAARETAPRPHGISLLLHRLRALWRKAAQHASAGSAELHHAWRCAAAAGLTYLIVHLLELPFGYWATMATMLVMQPTVADSWSRSMERAVGSVVGGALAIALCLVAHTPLALAVLVFPLTVLTMALRPVSYGLYATFLTPVFVLVADVGTDPAQQLANAALRAGNNVIGAAVAVAASYLFWPRRQGGDARSQLLRMVQLNLAYLIDAVQGAQEADDLARMHAHRRDACVANVEAGLLLQRLMRERGRDDHAGGAGRTAVALSRRLAAAASHLWAHPQAAEPDLAPWLHEMGAALQARDAAALHALMRRRPAPVRLAQADAVETLCLLAAALMPQGK